MRPLDKRYYTILAQCIISVCIILVVTGGCFYASDVIGYKIVALVLLMAVSFIAMIFDILPVLIAAVLSAIGWNYFFIPPLYTFHIDNTEDVLMFSLYFIIALVNAVLTFKIRKTTKKLREEEEKEKTIKLYNNLLNSLSHELRTPISTIFSAVDVLREEEMRLSADRKRELIAQIDEASVRLNRQVENLLNMSRLESGMLKLKIDWCDLNELVLSVIRKLESEHHRKIAYSSNDKLPLFKLDIGLMEQVLQNLLHNALIHTNSGAEVKIKILHEPQLCRILVVDNGGGFPPNEIENVFHKFYRLSNAKTGGSGLGLSIVRGFVEAHNGIIQLTNNEIGGATFTIEIPAETSYLNNLNNE